MNGCCQEYDAHTQFLMDVHARCPGLTERSIGAARTGDGLSSYEAFCRFADPQPGMTVVDLACGNGPLCELLAKSVGPFGQVVGMDLSEAELKLAEERLRCLPNVRLKNESSERLSLPDAAADLVVCHMAFMLFSPLKPAVAEIGRILKRGGAFAAVIPTLRTPDELFRECAGVLRAALLAEHHPMDALSGNAVSMNCVPDLEQIFSEGCWSQENISTCAIDVSVTASPDELADRIAPAFYHYHLLSLTARRGVGLQWAERFARHADGSGRSSFHFPLSAFLVRKRMK